MLHRDVKPANVLIDPYGHAGLADFGLAVMTDGMDLEERLEALTPAYAPPEAFAPHTPTASGDVTEGWIEVETEAGRGYGYIRLKNGLVWTLLVPLATVIIYSTVFSVILSGFSRPAATSRPIAAAASAISARPP